MRDNGINDQKFYEYGTFISINIINVHIERNIDSNSNIDYI